MKNENITPNEMQRKKKPKPKTPLKSKVIKNIFALCNSQTDDRLFVHRKCAMIRFYLIQLPKAIFVQFLFFASMVTINYRHYTSYLRLMCFVLLELSLCDRFKIFIEKRSN